MPDRIDDADGVPAAQGHRQLPGQAWHRDESDERPVFDQGFWDERYSSTPSRTATDPAGQPVVISDAVLRARRR